MSWFLFIFLNRFFFFQLPQSIFLASLRNKALHQILLTLKSGTYISSPFLLVGVANYQ